MTLNDERYPFEIDGESDELAELIVVDFINQKKVAHLTNIRHSKQLALVARNSIALNDGDGLGTLDEVRDCASCISVLRKIEQSGGQSISMQERIDYYGSVLSDEQLHDVDLLVNAWAKKSAADAYDQYS